MSRNLCRTDCHRCSGEVRVVGIPYYLPQTHFSRPNMLAADAECVKCQTRYTAWMGPTTKDKGDNYGAREVDLLLMTEFGFFDLSYRSTFNDEPGESDVPPFGKNEVDYLSITRDTVRVT